MHNINQNAGSLKRLRMMSSQPKERGKNTKFIKFEMKEAQLQHVLMISRSSENSKKKKKTYTHQVGKSRNNDSIYKCMLPSEIKARRQPKHPDP